MDRNIQSDQDDRILKNVVKKGPKRPRSLRLQERDLELLRWINGFGWINVEMLMRKWEVSATAAGRRLMLLHHHGLLNRQTIAVGFGLIYWPTRTATGLVDDDMLPLKQISLRDLYHSYRTLAVAIRLEKQGGTFEPERRLRRKMNQKKSGLGVTGHVPDGLLWLDDRELPVAIEVELSLKNKRKIQRICKEYMYSNEYDSVRYYTDKQTVKTLLEKTYEDFEIYIEVIKNGEW